MYIAVSAFLISSVGVAPSCGNSAMPTDGVTDRSRPSASTGSSIALQQLVRDLGDVVARGVVQQHDELVAAEARHDVARAQAGGDARRHGLQQAVADQVAQRIVDALEVVEVDEQQRQRRGRPARACSICRPRRSMNDIRFGRPVSASWCAR